MKRMALYITTVCFCFGLFAGVVAQSQKRSAPLKSKTRTQAVKTEAARKPGQQTPAPVRVLVRKLQTGTLAFDGLMFVPTLEDDQMARKLKAEDLQNTHLVSGRGVKVEQETIGRVKLKTKEGEKSEPEEWKKDPAGFDYLINWTIDYDEHTKWSMLDKLKITVKESWKIESVKDPTAAKTWTASYVLQPDWKMGQPELPAALEQTATVIAPAREPILKEIRAFINLKP